MVRQNIMVAGYVEEQSCSPHGGQETERERYRKGPGQDIAPMDMLLVTYFLLKFPAPSKIAPPAGVKASTHESVGEFSYS
jgi:hypothetical protein